MRTAAVERDAVGRKLVGWVGQRVHVGLLDKTGRAGHPARRVGRRRRPHRRSLAAPRRRSRADARRGIRNPDPVARGEGHHSRRLSASGPHLVSRSALDDVPPLVLRTGVYSPAMHASRPTWPRGSLCVAVYPIGPSAGTSHE